MTGGNGNIERPHFVIEEDADDAVSTRLRTIERRINESPALFQNALENLGELATKDTIAFSERDDRTVTLRRAASDMITEFFTQRYDLEMSFDDATEQALAADSKYRELQEDMFSKRSEYVRKGVMGSTLRPNEKAVPAREKLRQYRLKFYIGQVIAAKASDGKPRTAKGKLRSTG